MAAIVEIPKIDIETFAVTVIGDSPLIVHNWSHKAKQAMLDKQMKKASTKGHDVRNPVEDFITSLYWLSGPPKAYTEAAFEEALRNGARFGFPATAFKAAAVSAGYRGGVTKDKVSTNAAFHIIGDMVEIFGTPAMREDMVRIGMGTADLRYRGEFKIWSAVLNIRYNRAVFSREQIINLINMGGFGCGIGEWRPEKGGSFGMYHVGSKQEIASGIG